MVNPPLIYMPKPKSSSWPGSSKKFSQYISSPPPITELADTAGASAPLPNCGGIDCVMEALAALCSWNDAAKRLGRRPNGVDSSPWIAWTVLDNRARYSSHFLVMELPGLMCRNATMDFSTDAWRTARSSRPDVYCRVAGVIEMRWMANNVSAALNASGWSAGSMAFCDKDKSLTIV